MSKKDPGPCPVDDAPHTTCTSADYDPNQIIAGKITPAVSVTVPAPGVQPTPPVPEPASTTFSTLSRGVPGRKPRR